MHDYLISKKSQIESYTSAFALSQHGLDRMLYAVYDIKIRFFKDNG